MPEYLLKHQHIVILLLLALTTIGAYAPILGHDFINLDDNGYVYDNAHVKAGLTAATVYWAFTTFTEANWHPLTWLSHALDCSLYGHQKAMGHHLTGLLFHLLNVLLVFLVLSRMTGWPWRSAFVAALFAIHPLHVESVAWVAERKDVLSTFFWLLTMLAYVYYAESPRIGRYLLVAGAFALGLMAKPMLVSLPLVLLLMDYWPLKRLGPEAGSFAKRSAASLLLEKAPLFALALGSCVVTFVAQRSGGTVATVTKYPVGVRLANAVVAYATYLHKTVWPSDMSVFYSHPGRTLPEWQTTGAVVILAAISALVFLAGRRRPYLIVGWLWYLITLVPVIGFVQVGNQAMADRYTYIPLIGIFIAAAWAIPDLLRRPEASKQPRAERRRAARSEKPETGFRAELVVPALVVVLLLIVVTSVQISYWQDSISLFTHVLKLNPKDGAAQLIVADAMMQRKMDDQAIELFRNAVRRDTKLVNARYNLGILLQKHGYTNEAIEDYRELLRRQPNHAQAHSNLGDLLLNQGKLQEAAIHFQEAIRSEPTYAIPWYNMGILLQAQQQYRGAEQRYLQAIKLKPDYWQAHGNLAVVYYQEGRYADAWSEVRLTKQYGGNSNPNFLQALKLRMPEPKE